MLVASILCRATVGARDACGRVAQGFIRWYTAGGVIVTSVIFSFEPDFVPRLTSVIMVPFAAVGLLYWLLIDRSKQRLFGLIGFVFLLGMSMKWIIDEHAAYRNVVRTVQAGEAQVLEGRVSNFIRGSRSGNIPDRFELAGRRFEVRADAGPPAFVNTVARGGPNLDGLCLRIQFVEGPGFLAPGVAIVKIEELATCPEDRV